MWPNRLIPIPAQIQTLCGLAGPFDKVAAGQDRPLFPSRLGRFDQFDLEVGANCSVCIVFPSKGKSLTTATGRAVVGSLHVLTSSHATTGSTQATGHFSARNATGPSRGQIISLSIWRDTYETRWRNEAAIKKTKEMPAKPWTNLWPTICLQAVVKQQDKLWSSRQKRKKKTKKNEHYSLKSLALLSRPIPSSHIVQVTWQDLSDRVVKLLWKGTKLEFVLLNRQSLEEQVPAAFNWKCISVRETRSNRQTSPKAFYQQHANIGSVKNYTLFKYCINKYIYIYIHISPAIQLISGTKLIYTEWCSVTPQKVFVCLFVFLRKGTKDWGFKLWKSAIWLFVCFLETSLPQLDLNQVNTSLRNGDGNL